MIQPALLRKQRLILVALILLIVLTIVIGLGLGYSALTYDRLLPVLFGKGTFKEEFVLFQVRLPRMLVTLLGGMALALSGAILQGITRNDLADPGIIGINSGAGVAITIFFLFLPINATAFAFWLPVVAFLGAMVTAIAIYAFSYRKNSGFQPIRLVLIGVGFSMALSGLMIILISSAERMKVDFISRWISGNIWGTDWPYIYAILPWLVVLVPFTLYKANRINILSLGEPIAIGLGVSVAKERFILLLTAVALAASAVSITGGIAFIGLMSPHIAKTFVGPRNQLFIPIAILIGGWLLLTADTIGRHILDPQGLPAGIMVALIGAPYFLFLLVKSKNI